MCVQNERRTYGYGGGVNRRSWNNKSTAAINRQNAAVNKFLEVRKRHESTCKGKEGLILLLTPAEHLTGACYTTFRKKVAEVTSYAKRWEVLRTVATEEEKKSYKITRKGKAYWIFVKHNGGKTRICDCGESHLTPYSLPQGILKSNFKTVSKRPEPKTIENIIVSKLNQSLLNSYREDKELKCETVCACGKRTREDADGSSSSSSSSSSSKNGSKAKKSKNSSSSSSKTTTTTTTTTSKTETKTDKTFCKNECEDFQYCLEYLLVKKEKELGLGMISRIQTF